MASAPPPPPAPLYPPPPPPGAPPAPAAPTGGPHRLSTTLIASIAAGAVVIAGGVVALILLLPKHHSPTTSTPVANSTPANLPTTPGVVPTTPATTPATEPGTTPATEPATTPGPTETTPGPTETTPGPTETTPPGETGTGSGFQRASGWTDEGGTGDVHVLSPDKSTEMWIWFNDANNSASGTEALQNGIQYIEENGPFSGVKGDAPATGDTGGSNYTQSIEEPFTATVNTQTGTLPAVGSFIELWNAQSKPSAFVVVYAVSKSDWTKNLTDVSAMVHSLY